MEETDTTRTSRLHPDDAKELERRLSGELLDGWEDLIPKFTAENGSVASRAASGIVLNAIAPKCPELVGGSADLASSTNTIVKGAPSIITRRITPAATYPFRNSRAWHGRRDERNVGSRRYSFHTARRF